MAKSNIKEHTLLCPTCDGPCYIVEPDDEDDETGGELTSIIDELMLDAVALGRMQLMADTLGYRVEVLRLAETMPTSVTYWAGDLQTTQYIVYNEKQKKIGNGISRLLALQRAFGMLGNTSNPKKEK